MQTWEPVWPPQWVSPALGIVSWIVVFVFVTWYLNTLERPQEKKEAE